MCVTAFLSGRALAESIDNQRIAVKTNQTVVTSGQINLAQTTETESTDGWNLILVNKTHPVKENYPVKLVQLKNGQAIDERAYPALQAMMDDARATGLSPYICSSYRTNEKQTTLYNNQVNKYRKQGYSEADAAAEAGKWVAVPGTSEHQIGLAVDIVAKSYQVLDKKQERTAEQRWLMENCHKYGFILRYPSEKSEITGIGYEPWHYRYVGKEAAAAIMKEDKCLEEYLDEISSNIAGGI
jgi:D-alanyl-D-alanine carboxypeptidase